MAESLMEEHDRVLLKRPLGAAKCVWTRDTIDGGTYSLVLRTAGGLRKQQRAAYCKLGSVVDLQQTLRSFEEPTIEKTDEVKLSPSGDVRYHLLTASTRNTCAVCDKLIQGLTPTITLYQQKVGKPRSLTTVRMHADCRERLAEAIEGVWNHPELALPEQL